MQRRRRPTLPLPLRPRGGVVRTGSGASVTYSHRQVRHETETTTFSAAGKVKLDSGDTIEFSVKLSMNRELTEINGVAVRAGNMSDPIAVNLDGAGVRLNPDRQPFDLNGDGVDEMIATLAEGSAWLARDIDGNGAVDSGRELFGPSTANGFRELAALDTDRNGWIDEGDAAFVQLGLWRGDTFTSLSDAGIGALATAAVNTPFAV